MPDLNERLLNVRRATRLLASYYRRVLDIAKLLETALVDHDGTIAWLGWSAAHYKNVGQKRVNITQRWAWDQLPFAFSYLEWSTEGGSSPANSGDVFVALQSVTDSGFSKPGGGAEPDPVDFEPAESASTYLQVCVIGLANGACEASWDDIWNQVADEVHDKTRIDPQDEWAASEDVQIYSKMLRVDASQLPDRAAVQAQLIEPTLEAIAECVTAGE